MAAEPFDFDSIKFAGEMPNQDPIPKTPPKKSTPTRPVGRPSTNSKLKDLENEISQLIKFGMMPVKMRDMHDDGSSCADILIEYDGRAIVLTEQGKALAAALAAVAIDSKFIMKMLDAGDLFGKYGMLAMALAPVAMTVYNNHLGRNRYGVGESAVV